MTERLKLIVQTRETGFKCCQTQKQASSAAVQHSASFGANENLHQGSCSRNLKQGVFSDTKEAQPLSNKSQDKPIQGCPDWLPNTPAGLSG